MTSGAAVRRFLWRYRAVLVLLLGFGLVTMIVNVATVLDDRAGFGHPVAPWEPWLWEASSFVVWTALAPIVGAIAIALFDRPLALRLAAALALTVPIAGVHVVAMVLLRDAGYALAGSRYVFDWRLANLLYEWRKDALTCVVFGAAFLVHRRLLAVAETPAPAAETPAPLRLEVRDRGRIHWLGPTDIAWAEAAGNYVELHTRDATLLHRTTLAALADQLAPHGFVRIHRSRIVRRDAVRAIAPTPSGDFQVDLGGGTCLAGSRRYRAGLG